MSKFFPQINKLELIGIMQEHIPQTLWPPRPTQQSADTIREVVRRASFNGFYGVKVRAALGALVTAKRSKRPPTRADFKRALGWTPGKGDA